MANPVVVLNISQQQPPVPSTLQQTGVLLTQGGTTLAPGTLSTLLTPPGGQGLSTIQAVPAAISSLSWGAGEVTVTTTSPLPSEYTTGTIFNGTIAGAVPSGYDGTFVCTVVGPSTFTYSLASSPGIETTAGTWVNAAAAELVNMVTTFFAQGNIQGVYVLELGPGTVDTGVAELSTWLTNNPFYIYAGLAPLEWDGNASFLTLLANYEALDAMLYFVVTTSLANQALYTEQMKNVFKFIPSPTAPASEFGAAMILYNILVNRPGPGNRQRPMIYRFGYGVTPWPVLGNGPNFATMEANFVNYFTTGQQGGISTAILRVGSTCDGNDGMYWYSVDWFQINLALNLTNVIINGSNTNINPLIISQDGVNRLQNAAFQTEVDAVKFGLAVGSVVKAALDGATFAVNLDNGVYDGENVVNAVPFLTYYQEAPGDYKAKVYNGLQCVYLPAAPFAGITVNVNVSQFVAAAV